MRRRLVAGVLLCCLPLAGCTGDDPEADPLPPVSSSAGGSISPTPSASASPATEEEAVEAAVRGYYGAFEMAVSMRDVSDLESRSVPECPCRSVLPALTSAISRGEVSGGSVTVESVSVAQLQGLNAVVNATTVGATGRITYSDGRVEPVPGEGRANKVVSLVKIRGQWLIANVVRLDG